MHKKTSRLPLVVTAPVVNSGRTEFPQDCDDLLLAMRENGGEDLLNGSRGEREEGRNKKQLILSRILSRMLRTGIWVKGKATFRRIEEEASGKTRFGEKDGVTSYLETCQMKRHSRREINSSKGVQGKRVGLHRAWGWRGSRAYRRQKIEWTQRVIEDSEKLKWDRATETVRNPGREKLL